MAARIGYTLILGFAALHAFAGQAHHYVVQLADGREVEIVAPGAAAPLARGAVTRIAWSPDDVILLPGGGAGPGGAQ